MHPRRSGTDALEHGISFRWPSRPHIGLLALSSLSRCPIAVWREALEPRAGERPGGNQASLQARVDPRVPQHCKGMFSGHRAVPPSCYKTPIAQMAGDPFHHLRYHPLAFPPSPSLTFLPWVSATSRAPAAPPRCPLRSATPCLNTASERRSASSSLSKATHSSSASTPRRSLHLSTTTPSHTLWVRRLLTTSPGPLSGRPLFRPTERRQLIRMPT